MDETFLPKRAQHYHDYLQQGLPSKVFVTYRRAYIRNISHSLQYMEYISNTISALPAHAVIQSQLIKTFVITGCSTIESILWMLLKAKKLNKKLDWEEIQRRETNKFSDNGKEYKFEVVYSKKIEHGIEIEMKFVEMCKRAEKTELLGVSSDVYSKLNHLRKLRNRIHIHSVQHDRDNDFWTFSKNDFSLMANTLVAVLKSDIFSPHPNYENMFGWLDAVAANSLTTG